MTLLLNLVTFGAPYLEAPGRKHMNKTKKTMVLIHVHFWGSVSEFKKLSKMKRNIPIKWVHVIYLIFQS